MDVEGGEELFAVSVKGNGITIEKEVPAQVARHVINALMGGAINEGAPALRTQSGSAGDIGSVTRRISLREFLEEGEARRNPDKILTIAEYILRFEATDLFTKEDIKDRFRLAGEAAPANFPRDFGWAVKNGWIAEDLKSRGSFYVTQKGRNAIESKFSSEIKKITPQPASRKRSRRVTAARGEASRGEE